MVRYIERKRIEVGDVHGRGGKIGQSVGEATGEAGVKLGKAIISGPSWGVGIDRSCVQALAAGVSSPPTHL